MTAQTPSMPAGANFEYTGREELDLLVLMERYNDHIVTLCARDVHRGSLVLDFGAGLGTITSRMRARTGAAVDCIELDARNAETLQAKGFTVYKNADHAPAGRYDVVYSSNVLEHVADETAALRALYAALKPGGVAAFWVPAFNVLWTAMDDRVEHQRRYTRRMLENAFHQAGFEVERSFYQDSIGFFVTLLLKIIEKLRPGKKGGETGMMNRKTILFYDRVLFPLSRLLDLAAHPFLGKNAFIYARKPLTAL